MSISDSIKPEIAYKCDICGELFNSPKDAQNHTQKAHLKSGLKDELGSRVTGTSTPAEDREEERSV
jgi:uncharacterized C2H2 Zn-finger protein